MPRPIGLVPAAGHGVRFGAAGYAKELFPLLLSSTSDDGQPLAPRPVCELALRGVQRAGADRCIILVSPHKTDIVRVLADRADDDMSLAYVVQANPHGLPHAIRCARPWLGDADVVFALPDTITLPADALARVHAHRVEQNADLGLGIFPVDEPEQLGPVDIAEDGTVIRIHDKPRETRLRNSWGVASWSARFTAFCCDWDENAAQTSRERVLGHVFEAARAAGMSISAQVFNDGKMLDIGTPAGLRVALTTLAQHGVIDAM